MTATIDPPRFNRASIAAIVAPCIAASAANSYHGVPFAGGTADRALPDYLKTYSSLEK